MANIAFDKHVQFCEEYIQEVQQALITLFRKGPTSEILTHTNSLYRIQQKYLAWLTPKLEDDLANFETTLRKIGADAQYLFDNNGTEERQKMINQMYKTFSEVIGLKEWNGEKLTDQLAASNLIRQLRKILGTEELTSIRNRIVLKALD